MRLFFLLICALLFQPRISANAQSRSNVAYRDVVVWHLSSRLAKELIEFQVKHGVLLDDGKNGGTQTQYEIHYHHYLVECNGPLSKVAKILESFEEPKDLEHSNISAIAYIETMNDKVWSVLYEWNVWILLQLLSKAAEGHYGFSPECVAEEYRKQNPLPMPE